VSPWFGFYDDSDSPNAFALNKEIVPGRQGTVLFGSTLFSQIMNRDPTGIIVIQVAAHEFGHIAQYASGQIEAIQGGVPTKRRIKLHADFLSGFFLGLRKLDHPEASLWKTGEQIWELGDLGFNNPEHHGTPEERVAAAEAGFTVSYKEHRQFPDAFDAASHYVASR
jgi:hypothetical protein